MERNRSLICILLTAAISLSGGMTQEQNIQKTVEYINKAIEKDPYYDGKDDDLEFKVDDKGTLTAQYYWGSYKAFKHTMSLKNLDKGKVKRDTSTIYGRDIIRLYCKETDHCIQKKVNHKPKTREMGKYEFSVTDKNEAGRRVKNAFVHLIERAQKRFKGSSKNNGDDPYDY